MSDTQAAPWRDRSWLHAAYVDQGKTAAQIAADLGISTSVIFAWLRRHGIDTKRGQYPRGEAHALWTGKRVCPSCNGSKRPDAELCDPCSRPGRRQSNAPAWAGDEVGYAGAHVRVRALRGAAASHPCASCGEGAAHWAYDHRDPDERWGKDKSDRPERPYSLDPSHYQPLCRTCHRRLDVAAARSRWRQEFDR